jgi:hypothetical protein
MPCFSSLPLKTSEIRKGDSGRKLVLIVCSCDVRSWQRQQAGRDPLASLIGGSAGPLELQMLGGLVRVAAGTMPICIRALSASARR